VECGSRVRVTLDRSSTGKGRRREVDVWERGLQVSPDELEKECSRRDRKISEQGSLVEEGASETPQQTDLPTIYARNWKPSSGLEFSHPLQSLRARGELLRFIAERHDGYLELVAGCWDEERAPASFEGDSYHEFCLDLLTRIGSVLSERILEPLIAEIGESEVIPRRSGTSHLSRRNIRFLLDIRICLRRIAYESSITLEQRKQWQRWMTRTRVTDEHLKELFTDGVPTPDGGRFGGKGFRSTWQEGIVACASAMNRAVDSPQGNGGDSDIIAPMIRDMGLALAMGQTPLEVLSAQMGKSGSYMDGGNEGSGGRDLHIGNWEKGILPPTAPLPIASATTTGVALASHRLGLNRFHLAPVGEGCSSSGEFWEAMNLAGTRGLPICYMIQNNQIALDTFVVGQSGAETFGDKGHAMGIPSWTIDGSDPSQFYSSVCVAREIAVSGGGATLIHVETMRGCGHAHHHDDLYLGSISGTPPGYVDRELISYWSEKDPLPNHRNLLIGLGASEKELQAMESEERAFVEDSRAAMEEMPWPEGNSVGEGVTSIYDARSHAQQFDTINTERQAGQSKLESGRVYIEFSDASNSWTFSRSIQNAMVELAEKYGEQIIFMGEDMEVAGAFGMNLPLRAKGHQSRLLDMPLSESIIINSATGAALGGMRPVAEIQFGGFAALAMNPLINNAAQLRWRWGADVPMTVRIPLGAKTRSGPYHANMIESWFANDPGLVIAFPSNPQDAFDLLIEGHALPDPFVFLEHIGLYGLRGGITGWGDSINQIVDTESVHRRLESGETSIGKGKIVRGGKDITIVTWGAMVHVALEAAEKASAKGVEVEIVDLRTIQPFDVETCVDSTLRTGRLIVLQEAQWTGGLGHTISSRILEQAFWSLESPPTVIGALDTPVPFSPTLEDHTIPTSDLVLRHVMRSCE
jgi:2-oxoisovalerate dehydrogenase E1 component